MWFVAGLASFGLSVLAHVIVCRTRIALNGVFKFVVVAMPMGALLTILLLKVYGVSLESWASLLLYALLCELYVFTFTMVGSSVSVSILMRLRAGGRSIEEIERQYSAEYMVESRFSKLVNNDLLAPVNGDYVITDRGKRLLHVFEWLRSFFRHAAPPDASAARREDLLKDRAEVGR